MEYLAEISMLVPLNHLAFFLANKISIFPQDLWMRWRLAIVIDCRTFQCCLTGRIRWDTHCDFPLLSNSTSPEKATSPLHLIDITSTVTISGFNDPKHRQIRQDRLIQLLTILAWCGSLMEYKLTSAGCRISQMDPERRLKLCAQHRLPCFKREVFLA